jgi:hypothetical protein
MYECDTIERSNPLSKFDEPRQWFSELDESEVLTYEESNNADLG